MIALIKKELSTLFCSILGLFFAFFLLLITGLMLWLFAGSYNILDNAYADIDSFFTITLLLFIVLIPALTMRTFAEEKRTKTFELLRSRPIKMSSIFFSKLLASWIFIVITILPSIVYVCSVYYLGIPIGNIDLESILACYLSLFLLALVFCSVDIFCSSISNNSLFSLLIAILINVFLFYGFNLCASLFLSGHTRFLIASWGISYHYQLMQRGVIQLNDLITLLNYIAFFSLLTIYILNIEKRIKPIVISGTIILVLNIGVAFTPNLRFDFTADKRYSLGDYSKNMLHELANRKQAIKLNIFLVGDLNPSFERLQKATQELVIDLNRYSNHSFETQYRPSITIGKNPLAVHQWMKENRMPGIILNEVSRDGKSSQKEIYPYAQLISGKDTIPIPLLKNVEGHTSEENINTSIENLEFEFMDALRLLNQKENRSIAFIEGHQELPREYIQDAENLLSKYFSVNRGQIGYNTADLENFKVVIIAGSMTQFNEREKYILDQYIMNGGRVLWLIDGVYYSSEKLVQTGESPSMKNDTNLDDLLFNYGVRINPILIQDALCSSILLNIGSNGQQSAIIPCYYSPLLIPSPNSPITKDISNVKAMFVNSIDFVGKNVDVKKTILLTSSDKSHVIRIPQMINFNVNAIQSDPQYFKESYLTTAVSLEGKFNSAFMNHPIPDSVTNNQKICTKSVKTKMIVVASSDIIRSELAGMDARTHVLPMGYDRISGKQFGNRAFIVNAVNWLANDDNWMSLRSKQQQLRLLDKKKIYDNRKKYTAINIITPILLLFFLFGFVNLRRKWKYQRKQKM